jgi:hypothetical protein
LKLLFLFFDNTFGIRHENFAFFEVKFSFLVQDAESEIRPEHTSLLINHGVESKQNRTSWL